MKTLPQLIAAEIISAETIEQLRLAGWYLRPLAEQERDHAAQIAAVKAQEDTWADRFAGGAAAGERAFGAIRVGGTAREIGKAPAPKTLVPLSQDMVPHLSEIFTERDAIIASDPAQEPDAAMRQAIQTVRQRKDTAHGA